MTTLSLLCIGSASAADVGTNQTHVTDSNLQGANAHTNSINTAESDADDDKAAYESDAWDNVTSADEICGEGVVNAQSVNSMKKYLQPTKNCQVNDPKIKALAKKLTNGKKTTYQKAAAIFQWVNDHTTYSRYNNSHKGAIGTLNAKTGNCCDLSHLVVALERAAGIPARYVHGSCFFYHRGQYEGHVWAQIYVNGKWYNADASDYRNTFGVVKNWNTKTVITRGGNYGAFISLPI